MDLNKISNFIKSKRKELGITQEELAEKLFVTEKAVSRWETGRGTPDISLLIPLSQELNVDVSEILNGEKSKKKKGNVEELIEYNEITKKNKFNLQFKLIAVLYVLSILIFLFYLRFEYDPGIELNYFIRLFAASVSSILIIIGNKIYGDNYVEKLEDKKKITKFSQVIVFVYYAILLFNMVIFARYGCPYGYNLIPFKSIIDVIKYGSFYAIIINTFGNLLIFIPLEYFIIELFKVKKFILNFILSFSIIFLIELSQLVLKVGVFDIDDLIMCVLSMMLFYVCYVYFYRNTQSKTIMKIKEIIKHTIFPLIVSVGNFIFALCLFLSSSIGIPIIWSLVILVMFFVPCVTFILYAKEAYRLKKSCLRVLFETTIYSFSFIFYYLIVLVVSVIIVDMNPVENPKYYNYYYHVSKELRKAFPSKIPTSAKNVKFYHDAGWFTWLYYIDDTMTTDEFEKMYKDKAMLVGHIDDFEEKNGILMGLFSSTPIDYENKNDFVIYLIEGRCDNSGYCNHGNNLIAAYNENTHEVVFSSGEW